VHAAGLPIGEPRACRAVRDRDVLRRRSQRRVARAGEDATRGVHHGDVVRGAAAAARRARQRIGPEPPEPAPRAAEQPAEPEAPVEPLHEHALLRQRVVDLPAQVVAHDEEAQDGREHDRGAHDARRREREAAAQGHDGSSRST
jgi:hypothetical protein